MNFEALSPISTVGHYFIRLALLDRQNNREFTACDRARCRCWDGASLADLSQVANRSRIGPPRKNKAHRLDRDLESHGYWDVTFCAMANGGSGQIGVIVLSEAMTGILGEAQIRFSRPVARLLVTFPPRKYNELE